MDWMLFRGHGLTMNIPSDWFITSSAQEQVIFIAPPLPDGGQSNVTISVRRVKSNVTAKKVATNTIESQQIDYPEFKEISGTDFTKDDLDAFSRHYRWRPEGSVHSVIQRQIFYLYDRFLFIITITRPDVNGADKLDKTFEKMVQSFSVIPGELE